VVFDTHEEIHEVMKMMDVGVLKEIVEKVVEDIAKEKARTFPDRLKRQREMMKKKATLSNTSPIQVL